MLFLFIVGTIITLLLFSFDKSQAMINRWRIPEWVLLFFTFFFGTLGAILGMILYRHKVQKKSFIIKFFIIVIIQILILYILGSGS